MARGKVLTPGGLFSVQSGWSLVSTRVRPSLSRDEIGISMIRRLLLDLARGSPEVATGLRDEHRYEKYDSNRLDPYQVGISILSAYANIPLKIFPSSDKKYKNITLADCVHACAIKCNLFFPTSRQKKIDEFKNKREFMSSILGFLSYIRDYPYSIPDHQELANRILGFCSITRESPPRQQEVELQSILNDYLKEKGRLIHISLKNIHKAANKLNLDQSKRWGWSVLVTVCFERAIDLSYQNSAQIFGGRAWLLSRTPGRALFFHQHDTFSLEQQKVFCSKFHEVLILALLKYCDEEDSKENRKIKKMITFDKDSLSLFSSSLIRLETNRGGKRSIKTLKRKPSKPSNDSIQEADWGEPIRDLPLWTDVLVYAAARGLRRFRAIQSMWQDILKFRKSDKNRKSILPQDIDCDKTFVYLDCIQLSELIWRSDENWIECFRTARILAPLIEVSLVGFICDYDTYYPKYAGDRMLLGPRALGGDELHMIVPCSKKDVKKSVEILQLRLKKHMELFGLVKYSSWIKNPKDIADHKLKLKNNRKRNPLLPKQLWWIDLIDLSGLDEEEMNEKISMFSENIARCKQMARMNWDDDSDDMFYMM
ncbi:MAG TPA: hypothetical protein EYQ73_04090 [Candidatus Poseidoniales archaeon]|nr:hypothetical protein [Candidatus Poseidoniales archaeon]